jgi:hypothetical protein
MHGESGGEADTACVGPSAQKGFVDMTRRMVRHGAAVLSAVAIAAGGAMAGGAGTAAAQGVWPNPVAVFNPLFELEASVFTALGSSDRVGCPATQTYRTDVRTVGDVTFRKGSTTSGYRGTRFDTWYTIGSDANSETIHRLTDYPPSADYKLESLSITWTEVIDGVSHRRTDDNPTLTVDPQTGAVTITGAYPIGTNFRFYYEGVPWSAKEGSIQQSGGGFSATGMEPQDWPVMEGHNFEVLKSPLTCGPVPEYLSNQG